MNGGEQCHGAGELRIRDKSPTRGNEHRCFKPAMASNLKS